MGNQLTLTPVMITELYDAFMIEKLFDNIALNNTMKVYHDGRLPLPSVALTVYGDIQRT